MFISDFKEIENLVADLERFNKKALPFATRNTVNTAAFKARALSQENIRNSMVTRNKFTERSIRVEQTRTLQVNRQEAVVGSTADYMEDQEFGATKRSDGRHGVRIPTSYSAGQEGSQPRTRLPRGPNRIQRIRLKNKRKAGKTRQQRNTAAIREAAQSGSKYVFLELARRKGIFKVIGGKRKPKIKMVHDLTDKSVTIPRNPWLAPAVAETTKLIPDIYRDSLQFQVDRLDLFR